MCAPGSCDQKALEGRCCLQAKRARVDAPGSGAQQAPQYSAHLPQWHYQPAGGDQAGVQVAHQGSPPAGQHQQAVSYQPAGGHQPGMSTAHQGYQPAAGAHHQQAGEYQPVGPGAEQGYHPAGEHQQELGGPAQQQGDPLYQQGAGDSQQQLSQEAGQAQGAPAQDSGLETGPTQESGDALHMVLCMASHPALLQHMAGPTKDAASIFLWCTLRHAWPAQQGAPWEGSTLAVASFPLASEIGSAW